MDTMSFSPWALFVAAGPVVRLVMAVLVLASIWAWYLILSAALTLRRLRQRYLQGDAAALAALGAEEGSDDPAGAMRRGANRVLAEGQGRLTDLAVIASVAPFVGLFGTVWGIMTAFSGIAAAEDVSLAVVAPGIAEALAATAYGLAAAIPASVGYSRLGAGFNAVAAALADAIDALAAGAARLGGKA